MTPSPRAARASSLHTSARGLARPALVAIAIAVGVSASACAAPTESALEATEDALASKGSTLPAICAAPKVGDCSFYAACIERTVPCGAEGYAIGYGTKYCERFRLNDDLSAEGLRWRDEVMVCLQRRLGRFLASPLRERATCEDIIEGAFDDHPQCYTEPGASVCDLPPSDWISIVATIDAQDLLSRRGRKQIGETAKICLDRWVRALFSPFSGASASGARASSSAGATLVPERIGSPLPSRAIVEALANDPFVDLAALEALEAHARD
ncbi:MAG: hypothetical protein JST00_37365 [Deltaproteobacteria bacterium]|nr:hypothetical protein [Deltaproteobacteria bacterium]